MSSGSKITIKADGTLNVPKDPIIPFIEGDGIGPDIWHATQMVLDAAISNTYDDGRQIAWLEIMAGEKSHQQTGEWLPDKTLDQIR